MHGPVDPAAQSDDTLFQTLIATAVDGIMVIDERGIVQVYNRACERLFQYGADEVIGQNIKMLMPAPYRNEHDGYLDSYRNTGKARIIGIGREARGQRKDGTEFPLYLSVGQGTLDGKRIFVGIVHDLTQLKAEEAAREEQRGMMASIVETSNDAIISKTLDGIVTSWNAAAERIFGYKAEEIIGKPISILFPPDLVEEEAMILAKLSKGESIQHYETVRRRKNGAHIDISLTVSPLFDASGKIVGASKTARDITERKAAEARLQLLQSELTHVARLSEMGQFSAALAHELNQPLTAILNYTNVAKRLLTSQNPDSPAKTYETIAKAGQQAQRAGQIIRRMRDFVEKRDSKRTIEDVNKIAADAMALGLVGTKVANIKMQTIFASRAPAVLVDKVQIQQVLVNLLRNAAEAMTESPRRELTVTTTNIDDTSVELSVADTGPGIPDELAKRLFEPFVTTKVGGMGIGLAISQSIVEAHGGQLRMTPNKDGGTIFHFRLPAAPDME
ncbi:MAG: PAS domain S-box protein [Alphaproteobacteria bacterium]|nr:PAS domain S-box protein [Alphaproteobacteria bacterium]MDE1987004.1 PAS domain S-box protein [Alphaproteobacteria bacterium]MDE2164203.1 PAS domain S-box protein [Alphaproteobacteria bacterium]MDE2499145.1 PAS domain S-box protein [Alphaproteobacteria bacterium]